MPERQARGKTVLSGRLPLIGIARSTLSYERKLPQRDAPALEAMRRLAQQYPRYGYRRIRIFLGRDLPRILDHFMT